MFLHKTYGSTEITDSFIMTQHPHVIFFLERGITIIIIALSMYTFNYNEKQRRIYNASHVLM